MNDHSPYILTEHADALEIIIPVPPQIGNAIKLAFFLVVWGLTELFLTPMLYFLLVPSPNAATDDLFIRVFFTIWFVFWTLGGVVTFLSLLWITKGREVVTIDADTFTIRKEMVGIGTTKTYQTAHVRCLQPTPTHHRRGGRLSGAIGFAYQRQPVTWGVMLQEEDAQTLVEAILRRFPLLGECRAEDIPPETTEDAA